MSELYDLAVVGLGLIGAGALRHAAVEGVHVIGIGPNEPDDWESHTGPFASHYDSGRITRRLDAKREWAILASRSIDQYPTIEAATGVRFHEPAGLMFVRNDTDGIANQRAVAAELDIPITVAPSQDRRATLPHLHFPDGWTTLFEPAPAGFIDPRRMVRAQQQAARLAGAEIINQPVAALRRVGDEFEVIVDGEPPIRAERVVVATGAYGNQLIPDPLAMAVRPEAVVLGEVSEQAASELDFPSFIYLLDNPDLDDVYVVPPTRYPDGRFYIKLGGSRARASTFSDLGDMASWMQGRAADDQLEIMSNVLTQVLPDVAFLSWQVKPCLITDTASDLPFIDHVEPGLVVAFGGNGHAAKSADAIGAIATTLSINGTWTDSELDATLFNAQFGTYQPPTGSRHGN